MTQPLMFKLDQNAKGRGLRCDRDGLFFAGIALLERDAEDQFRSIPATTIRKALSGAYRADGNWESRIRSVDVVAKALNKGDVARAMMAAVLMRLRSLTAAFALQASTVFWRRPALIRMSRGMKEEDGLRAKAVKPSHNRKRPVEKLGTPARLPRHRGLLPGLGQRRRL